jgi:hypothetical protein
MSIEIAVCPAVPLPRERDSGTNSCEAGRPPGQGAGQTGGMPVLGAEMEASGRDKRSGTGCPRAEAENLMSGTNERGLAPTNAR